MQKGLRQKKSYEDLGRKKFNYDNNNFHAVASRVHEKILTLLENALLTRSQLLPSSLSRSRLLVFLILFILFDYILMVFVGSSFYVKKLLKGGQNAFCELAQATLCLIKYKFIVSVAF
jgi:hypothetical protein